MVSTQATLGADAVSRSSWTVWGTTAALAVAPAERLFEAARLLQDEIAETDRACNRFRPDSELCRLNRSAGHPVVVSAALIEALEVAGRAFERTGGAVDPTIGEALCALGYDRDFDELTAGAGTGAPGPGPAPTGTPAPGWRGVVVDGAHRAVTVPAGTSLDLGATAKALCADRAAARIAAELACSAVVALGGDVSVGGPPLDRGWQVAVVDDARGMTAPPHPSLPVVTLWRGGLATSGTSARSWVRGGRRFHHIVDPATGLSAPAVWRSVTVAAASCVDANTFSTAAVVWGDDAPYRIAQAGLAARFVPAGGGEVLTVGGWPDEDHPGR